MKLLLTAVCLAGIFAGSLHADASNADQASFLAKKESYQKKAADDLAEISRKIQELRSRSEQAGVETRANVDHQINLLERDLNASQKKLAKLEGQTAQGWEKFHISLDKAIENLKKSYQKTASKFK